MRPLHPLLDLGAHPVFGHRGASGTLLENTLPAFDLALEEGADGLEFDVRLSSDGVPVVIHDPTLDRTTGGSGPVLAERLAGLERLGVPALEEVLLRYREAPLLIELKVAEAAEPVKRLLVRHRARPRVMLASFVDRALRPFRGDEWATSASRRGILRLAVAASLGLPAPRGPDDAYSVPMRYRDRLPVATHRFIAAARRQGKPVHVWTVNEPSDAARLWALGASAMITNFPARMVAERNRLFGAVSAPGPGH